MIRILSEKFLQKNYSKQIITHISRLSSDRKADVIKKKQEEQQKIKWRKMYHFTEIRYLSVLTRMKIYPVLTTAFFVPISLIIEALHLWEGVSYVPCLIIGIKSFNFDVKCSSLRNFKLNFRYYRNKYSLWI